MSIAGDASIGRHVRITRQDRITKICRIVRQGSSSKHARISFEYGANIRDIKDAYMLGEWKVAWGIPCAPGDETDPVLINDCVRAMHHT